MIDDSDKLQAGAARHAGEIKVSFLEVMMCSLLSSSIGKMRHKRALVALVE